TLPPGLQASACEITVPPRQCGRPWASTSAASAIPKPPLETRECMTHNLPNRGMADWTSHAGVFSAVAVIRQKRADSTQAPLSERGATATVKTSRQPAAPGASAPWFPDEVTNAPMMSRRDQLQQMLQQSPDDAFLLYALAMEERSTGNDQAALSQLDRVLAVDSDYVAAYFQKGQILAGLDQPEQ